MSEISIDLVWELGDGKMTPDNYSNVHKIILLRYALGQMETW